MTQRKTRQALGGEASGRRAGVDGEESAEVKEEGGFRDGEVEGEGRREGRVEDLLQQWVNVEVRNNDPRLLFRTFSSVGFSHHRDPGDSSPPFSACRASWMNSKRRRS